MRLAPWILLALALPLAAEEREGLIRVSPITDAVDLVERSGRTWRLDGRAAEQLGPFQGRRVHVEGTFLPDGQARLRRLVSPAQEEAEAIPRADAAGAIQLELGDGRRFRAVGPAAESLRQALDRPVRARIHLFLSEREVWVDALRADVLVDGVLRRSSRLVPGHPLRFPVNRVRGGTAVWVTGSGSEGRLVVQPSRGPAGELEAEKLALSQGEPIPRHAQSMPATSLRQQLEGMVPGE